MEEKEVSDDGFGEESLGSRKGARLVSKGKRRGEARDVCVLGWEGRTEVAEHRHTQPRVEKREREVGWGDTIFLPDVEEEAERGEEEEEGWRKGRQRRRRRKEEVAP